MSASKHFQVGFNADPELFGIADGKTETTLDQGAEVGRQNHFSSGYRVVARAAQGQGEGIGGRRDLKGEYKHRKTITARPSTLACSMSGRCYSVIFAASA